MKKGAVVFGVMILAGTGFAGMTEMGMEKTVWAAEGVLTTDCKAVNPETRELCDKDEYILLSTGNGSAEIYDSQGECVGSCRAYLDDMYGAATVKKNLLLDYMEEDVISVYSMAELKTILELPGSEYYIQVNGDVCLTVNKNTGQFCLYDCHGNMMYRSGESEWTEGEYQGRLLVLDQGYLIGSCRFTDAEPVPALGPIWLSKDGQERREVTDAYLTEAFANWETQEFGDNLLIYSWENETGAVYDLDGNILLDQIEAYLYPYTEEHWFYSYNYNMKIALACQNVDETYIVYDTQLQECADFPALNLEHWDLGYAGGFIKGMTYQQLEGAVCDGFVLYKDKTWCPYAQTEQGCIVYADGKLVSVPLEEGQNLNSFNERYAVLGYDQAEMYSTSLIDRETGEVLAESHWNENDGISFEIGEDYCIITNMKAEGEDLQTSFTIRDNENQILCSAEKASAGIWENGYIVMKRGNYHGIADPEGNWIVKAVYGAEE